MVRVLVNNTRVSNNTLFSMAVFLSALLIVSFVVLMLSTVAGLQLGTTLLRPSPFSTFEAIWPGQSITSLAAYARQTPNGHLPCVTGASLPRDYVGLNVQVWPGAYDTLRQVIHCMDSTPEGVFRAVSVTIEDNQVQVLALFSDILQQDTMLLYWGTPDSITSSGNGQLVQLYWERSTYSANATVQKANSIVTLVSLTARD